MRCFCIHKLMSDCFAYLLLLIGFLHLHFLPAGECYGTFELQILEIENVRGEIFGGECCGGASRIRIPVSDRTDENQPAVSCVIPCRTFFNVCLKEYQNNMSIVSDSCSYGNATSPVLGGNSFTLADPDRANGKLVIRFKFSWTRAFTLLLKAVDLNNYTAPGNAKLIEKASYSGIILPSAEWHTLSHHGLVAKITYRIRVQCDKYYYNSTCMKFCRPRDDKFGHYTCDRNGNKECIAGWRGINCEIAVCKTGCHLEHGKCDYPGGCECRPGWRGEFCDQCQPYPDCKHGYCHLPYECICDTNWGGILCDKDLNYCGTHEPCLNGGTCSNTAPDQYFCTCPEGFSGSKCEIVINPCVTAPCANGSTCIEAQGHFQCICPLGWTGTTCSTNIDECASMPCLNGGTCLDEINGYECICPTNWKGDHCQNDTNECETTKPCVNAVSCHNLNGDYRCECQKGWSNKNCDQNINDCFGQCLHDSTCVDLVDDYYCVCTPGYTGKDCHIDVNECEINACKNGGECIDLVNGFRCICPVGFTGDFCQINHDHCNPNPCQNNARCLNMPEDYYCHCTENWQGKNCSVSKIRCIETPCDVVDNCLMVTTHSISSNGVNETSATLSLPLSLPLPLPLPIQTTVGSKCGDHGHCVLHADSGDFRCSCDPGYVGKYCQESKSLICKSNPCMNGGTCVNVETNFACICPNEFEGDRCQFSTSANYNNCNPSPCLNGGKCVSGRNWFLCECVPGFTGPDCRININECASNPCTYGSTCIDGIASYECICPRNRKGTKCEIAASTSEETTFVGKIAGACYWQGQFFSNNSNWQHKCNTCGCVDGQIRCTNVWCGFSNCLLTGCENANQICVPSSKEKCLSPPCHEWGECRDLLNGNRVVGMTINIPVLGACRPNQALLSDHCTRLTLYVDISKMRPSTSMEDVCNEIRRLISVREVTKNTRYEIIALCDLKQNYNDTIEITVSCNDDLSRECADAVKDDIKFVGEVIARKQLNSHSVLDSVMEIKLESAFITENKLITDENYLSIVNITIILLIVIIILIIILCWKKIKAKCQLFSPFHNNCSSVSDNDNGSSRSSRNSNGSSTSCSTNSRRGVGDGGELQPTFQPEKYNNIIRSKENFKRFANPLKENMACGTGVVETNKSMVHSVGLTSNRISHVTTLPFSSIAGSEMMEMITDSTNNDKGISAKALLSKTENSVFQKNFTSFNVSVADDKDGCSECCPSTSQHSCVKLLNVQQTNVPASVSISVPVSVPVPVPVQRNYARAQHSYDASSHTSNVFPTVLV